MPLTPEQTAIIKATVPILETGGEALTTHFYKLMFSTHPEVRPLFNQAHQAAGTQPRALANAVLCYARHIDHLDRLPPALVPQIVQKHVALNILPEHYPIVGSCLLQAIREVLGAETANDAVIDAWGAAYGQLAGILIGLEEAQYAEKEAANGGWRGMRAFRVARKERESEGITSFYLEAADGKPVLRALPGQYIAVVLEIDGKETRRTYSLSAACTEGSTQYRISVKRHDGGVASTFLHDKVQVGDTIKVMPPSGEFTLPAQSTKPLVLISAGVGITALLAMMEDALASPTVPHVHFVHTARNAGLHAFRAHVDALAAKHPGRVTRRYVYTRADPTAAAAAAEDGVTCGRLDAERLASLLPESRDVNAYVLGPKEFMRDVTRGLKALGVPAAQCRVEFFGPAEALE